MTSSEIKSSRWYQNSNHSLVEPTEIIELMQLWQLECTVTRSEKYKIRVNDTFDTCTLYFNQYKKQNSASIELFVTLNKTRIMKEYEKLLEPVDLTSRKRLVNEYIVETLLYIPK